MTNYSINPHQADKAAFRLNPKQSLKEAERLRNNGKRNRESDESNEETITERDEGRRDSLKTRFWQRLVNVRLLQPEFHSGDIQTMDCTSLPQHHTGPWTNTRAHTHLQRDDAPSKLLRCLSASKLEWRLARMTVSKKDRASDQEQTASRNPHLAF